MNKSTFKAINPLVNQSIGEDFPISDVLTIHHAVEAATEAFLSMRNKSSKERAALLSRIKSLLQKHSISIIKKAALETALSERRLSLELKRTIAQIDLFVDYILEGSWVDARIDIHPTLKSRGDIRHMQRPLGPVAVFGASNFPLAFCVAGGDTISALAAGCPVVFKAHPNHPATASLMSDLVMQSIHETGFPKGTFHLLQGTEEKIGETLVKHKGIKAVGFTGSFQGGKAMMDYANSRTVPIPVYAEMGSTNPIFIFPEAIKNRGEEIAKKLVSSINIGVGQFCTNPGLVFVPDVEAEAFFNTLISEIRKTPARPMLTEQIRLAYSQGTQTLSGLYNLVDLVRGQEDQNEYFAVAKIFQTGIENYFENEILSHEIFGPCSIIVLYKNKDQILKAASELHGHLTATLHAEKEELYQNIDLLHVLQEKVGRVIYNGFPTGVQVCHAMVHGGPYPATTQSQSTSVGSNAIRRFARPVCYQNFPDEVLPPPLRNANPHEIWRMINGKMTKESISIDSNEIQI